jgi:PAS domain S-box-containing protein
MALHSLVAWLVLLVLLLFGNAIVASWSINTLMANERQVADSLIVLSTLESTLVALQDAETGQRGYLITGSEIYLEPYTRAVMIIDDKIAQLKRLTAERPTQQARLRELEEHVTARLAIIEETLVLRETQGFEAAQQVILSGRGKEKMDAARAVFGEMRNHEEALLTRRMAEAQTNVQQTGTTLTLATLSSLALVAVAASVLIRDANARNRATEELDVQREWLAVTLESIGDAVIATDMGGAVTFMNTIAADLTGWKLDEARGRDHREVFRIINEHSRTPVESPISQVIRAGTVVGLANHTLLISKAGLEIPIDDSGAPIRNSQGKMIGVVLVFRDIRARKHQEQGQQLLLDTSIALATSLDYATTLDTVAELLVERFATLCVVFLVDSDGTIQRVAVRHHDPALHEALKTLQQPIDPQGPHLAAQVIRSGQALLNPTIAETMLRHLSDDDDQIRLMRALTPSSQIVVPLPARGRIIGALALGRKAGEPSYREEDSALAEELARRVALAVDNARLYRESQEAVKVRDSFLSIAAHELKTPLTSLLGQAQLLQRRMQRESNLSERDQRAVSVVVAQAQRLNSLIGALLDVSRIEHGQLAIVRTPLNLSELVQQVASEVQPLFTAHQLIVTGAETPLPILGDAVRIEQVLQNLLSNAVKYTPKGGEVRISLSQNEGMACVAVQDTGIGIPLTALPSLFQRFYRATNVGEHGIGGIGVGLYVVREIVTLHGGTVDVASDEGLGSTFTIRLPLG